MNALFTHILIYIKARSIYQPENSRGMYIHFSPQSRTKITSAMLIFTQYKHSLQLTFSKLKKPPQDKNSPGLYTKELREVSSQHSVRSWILSKELKALVQKRTSS